MRLSPKLLKRLLWIFLFPVIFVIVAGGILHYLIVTRFKDGVKYVINKESRGRYAFDASNADISFSRRSIQLKGATLRCMDTLNMDQHFYVQISEIYFSFGSWKELLFHKKIMVDSLAVIEPYIDLHVKKLPEKKEHAIFRPANIMGYLQKALAHLNVHSFSLKDAAFSYWQADAPFPIQGDHINLSVSNFMGINNEDSHLLGSDKVSMLLGKQRWLLPDGKGEVRFNQLTFDSKGQRFELDSFSFHREADTGKGAVSILADKFFFNSRHLPALYQKEQLLLDSLICINPVLSIPASSGEKNGPGSSDGISLTRKGPLSLINVKYIGVIDGKLLLQDKDGSTLKAATRKANLSVYNFMADSARDPIVSTDSIRINLRNVEFLTTDSSYKLTIDQFNFRGNDALFSNVRFGPVSPLPSRKKVAFTAPSLLLKNISFVELLRQRLKATAVELRQPLIVLYDKSKEKEAPSAARASSARKMALFYQSLHKVSEIINTPDFNIINGSARYRHTGRAPLQADAANLNVHILLNKFFVSDSLVDIKHAITNVNIDSVDLLSNNAKLHMSRLRFSGVRKYNEVGYLHLSTTGGLELKGENVFWYAFDWDVYQQTKVIQIDSLNAGRLTVSIKPAIQRQQSDYATLAPQPREPDRPGAGPVLRIGKLHADEITFDGRFPKKSVHFTLNNLEAESISSANRFFTWTSLKMQLHDLGLEDQKSRTTIREISFDSDRTLLVKGLDFRSAGKHGAIQLSMPELRLAANLHSTDVSRLTLHSLLADKTTIHYTHAKGKDTLEGSAVAAIRIGNTTLNKGRLQYERADIDLAAATVRKGNMRFHVQAASLLLSNGRFDSRYDQRLESYNGQGSNKGPALSTAVLLTWRSAGMDYNKDSMTLAANGFSGMFKEDAFRWSPGVKLGWQRLVANTTIDKGSVRYKGKKITADVAALSWQPEIRSLTFSDFSVIPNESRDTLFSKARWQGDYIDIKGNRVSLTGIEFPRESRLSFVRINKVTLDGILLNASRDKRIPFQHGLEKLMPTQLINTISFPVCIDTTSIQSSTVNYNECSAATGKWSSIPIQDINGTIVHLGNMDNQQDTLKMAIRGRLFDGHIRHFVYHELYGDSLSTFSASTWLSPIDLTRFSQVSVPAAAVSITEGYADTAWSSWQGNKYVSFGTMNFYYDKLKIKILNKNDSTKRGLLPAVETWLANLILPNARKRPSAIYVERDREKFVFNYWVKAQTSGLLSTIGIKSSKSYRRQYEKKWGPPPTEKMGPSKK